MDSKKAESLVKQLDTEFKEVNNLRNICRYKSPSYNFLAPLIDSSLFGLSDLAEYVKGKNSYFPIVSEDSIHNRQVMLHITFITELHKAYELGLSIILNDNNYPLIPYRKNQYIKKVNAIRSKVSNHENIEKELRKLEKEFNGPHTFNDYLESILTNVSLNPLFVKEARNIFKALSKARNKVSHSNQKLSEEDKRILREGQMSAMIGKDDMLQMTFEGYKLLIEDAIVFFDSLNTAIE